MLRAKPSLLLRPQKHTPLPLHLEAALSAETELFLHSVEPCFTAS
jgi:hypothetical protein